MTTLYALQDAYGGTTYMLAAGETPIDALDAYAVREGFPRYSDLDDRDEYVYERFDGLIGAVFTNYELVAVPVTGPVKILGPGMNGYGVEDAAGVTILDGLESPEACREALTATGAPVEIR